MVREKFNKWDDLNQKDDYEDLLKEKYDDSGQVRQHVSVLNAICNWEYLRRLNCNAISCNTTRQRLETLPYGAWHSLAYVI